MTAEPGIPGERHGRPLRPAPLAPVAIGMCAGIFIDDRLAIAPRAYLLGFVLSSAAAIALRKRLAPSRAVIAVAAMFAGAIIHDAYLRRYPSDHIGNYVPARPAPATVSGVILTQPTISTPSIGPMPTRRRLEPRTRFVLEIDEIDGPDGPLRISGKLAVTIKSAAILPAAGDRVRIDGTLYPIPPPSNPGQFDWRLRQRRQRIVAGLSAPHAHAITIVDARRTDSWRARLEDFRVRAKGWLTDGVLPGEAGNLSLLEGMILGSRSQVDAALDQAFIKTGTAHFLSVSGMNVAMLAVFVWGVATACGFSHRQSAVLVCGVTVMFVLVTEPLAPILRAGVMTLLACIGLGWRRSMSGLNWVAAAAIVLLAVQPTDLFGPGFQLSFVGVLSIMLVSPVLRRRLVLPQQQIEQLSDEPREPWFRRWVRGRVRRGALEVICVSAAAWVCAWPLVAYHFNFVSPYGAVYSAVLAPFVFAYVVLGYSKLLLGAVAGAFASPLAAPLSFMTRLLAAVVQVLAGVPGTVVTVRSPSLWWIGGYFALLGLIAFRDSRERRWRLPAIVLAAWIGLRLLPAGSNMSADTVRITALAVGPGTAAVIWLPNGRHVIYDAGSTSTYDVYQASLRPYLLRAAIPRIDHLVLSHPDFDHVAATAGLLDEYQVGAVWLPPLFDAQSPPGSAGRWLLDKLAREKLAPRRLARGDWLPDTGEVRIDALWPPADIEAETRVNDASTVLRIRYAGRTAILCGDIERQAIDRLLELGDLKADVLLLPHHGSFQPNTGAFIEAVAPQVILRSSGQPDRDTSARLLDLLRGSCYFNTADCGAVTVELSEEGAKAGAFGQCDSCDRAGLYVSGPGDKMRTGEDEDREGRR